MLTRLCPARNAFPRSQEQADSFKSQMGAQQQATETLINNTRLLENKLMEAKSKKDTLKARAASAKTSKQVRGFRRGIVDHVLLSPYPKNGGSP